MYIFASPGLAPCRRRPLSSNVRHHKTHPWQGPADMPSGSCGKLQASDAIHHSYCAMETTLDTLQAEVMKLSAVDRSRLLDALLDRVDQDEEVENEWERVADRRDAELDSGAVVAVDGPEVLERLKARFPG